MRRLDRWRARRAEPRCPWCGLRREQHPVRGRVSIHAWPEPITVAPAPPTEIPKAAIG